jgi:transcriptional regulator with XRE-family HTH domain
MVKRATKKVKPAKTGAKTMARSNRTHITGAVTDSRSPLAPKHLTKQEFSRRAHRLMRAKDWIQSDIARATKLSRNTISTWMKGLSLPTPQNLELLAAALDVAPEELLPNYTEAAIQEDIPALDLRVGTADPKVAWLQVNRLVSTSMAVKIIDLLNTDSVTAHRS